MLFLPQERASSAVTVAGTGDVYVAAYSSIYGTIFLSLLIGFLVACKFCAPQQHFSTPIHGCCGDMGQCCLSWWCPCVTWSAPPILLCILPAAPDGATFLRA